MAQGRMCLVPALFLALLGASCGGGGGGGKGQAPPPPLDVALSAGVNFDDVVLSWMPPAESVDGYEVEGKAGTEQYERFPDLVPGNAVEVEVMLDPSTPELLPLAARMRSVRGGLRSAYSNEATLLRGVRPPRDLAAVVYQSEKIRLAWTQASQVAETVRIERARYNYASASFGPYSQVADVSGASTAFVDDVDLVVGGFYRYRIYNLATYLGELMESTAVEDEADNVIELISPTDLSADGSRAGVGLAWSNRSSLATGITVLRAVGLDVPDTDSFYPVAQLPPSQASYLDATAGPGFYTYAVQATVDFGRARSGSASATVPPSGAVTLSLNPLRLPEWTAIARDPVGQWFTAFDRGAPSEQARLSISVPNGASWTRHDLQGGLTFAEPSIVLDGEGHPQTVYMVPLDPTTSNPNTEVVHEWFDGSVWHAEAVAEMVVDFPSASFAISPDGAVHILWQVFAGYDFPFYATNEGGSWTVTRLPSALYDPTYAYGGQLSAAPDGTIFVVVHGATQTGAARVIMRKPVGQAWTEEQLNIGPGLPLFPHAFAFVPSSIDTVALFYLYERLDTTTAFYRAQIAGVWRAEETIASYGFQGYSPPLAAAVSENRDALLVATVSDLSLFTRDPIAGWQSTVVRQSTEFDHNWVAFDASRHLQMLTPAGPASEGFRTYAFYEETE